LDCGVELKYGTWFSGFILTAVFGSRLFILFFSKYGSSCLNLKVARDNLVKKEI
jgi:hypothetical protein